MTDPNPITEIAGMSKEVYQLFDTTIKIGLGALISGIVTYLTTKMNHKHEIIKLEKNYEKEIKKLEISYLQETIKLETNYGNDINKTKLQMKIKIIEDIQKIVDEYIIICEYFLDVLLNCQTRKLTSIDELKLKDEPLYKIYLETKSKINNEYDNARKACAKFQSLGFNSSEIKLRKLNKIIIDEANRLNRKNIQLLNNEEYEILTNNFKEAQTNYYIAINQDIEKLK